MRVNGKQILATQRNSVLSVGFDEINSKLCLFLCSHEEADTRLILHAAHASAHGHRALWTVRTVDTDVVVLAITFWVEIARESLRIAFGVGKHFRCIAVHEVANALGPQKLIALTFVHAVTGCDTVSAFTGKGKKLLGMHEIVVQSRSMLSTA